MDFDRAKIGIVGLGYVGLPLAVEFAKKRNVIGYDLCLDRIRSLQAGCDDTLEVSAEDLERSIGLQFTADPDHLRDCGIFIITVPTPIDEAKRPDLKPLIKASALVGERLQHGSLVIYESTVFPGCIRNVCAPVLKDTSGFVLDQGFHLGYSPERINPGDKAHRLADIVKVTSGSSPQIAEIVDALYAQIIDAGTHKAPSIEVAEAAKVIENTQRDLNIALMNELSIIFNHLNIDTMEILKAAGTKWNFLPFRPGLVGGHCIGVDPYYLTHRAQEVGYHPEVILAGRRINDKMAEYTADRVARLMMQKGLPVVGSKVLVLGLAFKENCPDFRNSKVADLIGYLEGLNADVDVFDPWVSSEKAARELGINCLSEWPVAQGQYDAVVVAVNHHEFVALGADSIRAFGKQNSVVFDVKGIFPATASDGRL